MEDDREFVTFDEAVAMLPDTEEIHTFVTSGTLPMIGANWDRDAVLEVLINGKPELAGAFATNTGHGLCVVRGDKGPLFIETEHSIEEVRRRRLAAVDEDGELQ